MILKFYDLEIFYFLMVVIGSTFENKIRIFNFYENNVKVLFNLL